MNHFRLGSYMRLSLLTNKFKSVKNKKILDVGCNYGEIENYLSRENQVTAIDIDETALKIGKKTFKNVTFIKASATNLPFRDKSFDFIICLAVLEHIKNDTLALKEMSRVLKDKGEIILAVPNEKAELIPSWLTPLLKLINKRLKTSYPVSEKEYLHFGQEGIGHVRRGYTLKKFEKTLLKFDLQLIRSQTYWHAPSRWAYLFFMPLIRKGLVKEGLAKILFTPFLFLDKFIRDNKGDILIYGEKLNTGVK